MFLNNLDIFDYLLNKKRSGGSGGGENKLAQLIEGTITEITAADLEGITKIKTHAFYECKNLTGELNIPEGVTEIGDYAFRSCSGITSVKIPTTLKTVDDFGLSYLGKGLNVYITDLEKFIQIHYDYGSGVLFPDNSSLYLNGELITNLVIPESVTSVNQYVFEGYDKLTSVTFHNNVTAIKSDAFSYCDGLTSITIPDSVTDIVGYAFQYCKNLTSVTIGNGVTTLDRDTFRGCESLTDFTTASPIQKSFDLKYSTKLTIDSLKNIVNALVDYSGTTNEGKYKLTLNSTCNATLEAEGATAPDGLTWIQYIAVKGWNLA